MARLLLPEPSIQLRQPLLEKPDVLGVRRVQLPQPILVDVRDLARLYGTKEFHEPLAFFMPGFRAQRLSSLTKVGSSGGAALS